MDSSPPVTFNIMVDTTTSPPVAPSKPSITSTDNIALDGLSTVSVTWTESSSVDHYEILTDTAGNLSMTSTLTVPHVANGTMTASFNYVPAANIQVGIVAVDVAGNRVLSAPSDSVIVVADSTDINGNGTGVDDIVLAMIRGSYDVNHSGHSDSADVAQMLSMITPKIILP
jgi:hypothetical protein